MFVENVIKYSIPLLYSAATYPLIMQIVMLKKNRELILYGTIITNVIIGTLSIGSYYYFKLNELLYVALSVVIFVLTIYFVVYMLIFKKSLSSIFDSENILNKDGYLKNMSSDINIWNKTTSLFKMLCLVFIPIIIVGHNIFNINYTIEDVIAEILLITNWVMWRLLSHRFLEEKKRIESSC